MSAQLICEGPCNPGVGAYDRAIADYRQGETSDERGRLSPLQDPALVAAGRALRYTTHKADMGTARCTVCYAVRVWGGRR